MSDIKQSTEVRETIIYVRDLVKRFGRFVANEHLSFDVYKGEIFGFLGANGAGKTTAIRILCGLSTPTSGQMTVAGYDVFRQTEKIKQNIGFYGGVYGMKIAERKARTKEMLDRLDLTAYENRKIGDLPLGWKQKLAFSIAILHNPKIVFLDEPTGGVDPITRRQFWNLI